MKSWSMVSSCTSDLVQFLLNIDRSWHYSCSGTFVELGYPSYARTLPIWEKFILWSNTLTVEAYVYTRKLNSNWRGLQHLCGACICISLAVDSEDNIYILRSRVCAFSTDVRQSESDIELPHLLIMNPVWGQCTIVNRHYVGQSRDSVGTGTHLSE